MPQTQEGGREGERELWHGTTQALARGAWYRRGEQRELAREEIFLKIRARHKRASGGERGAREGRGEAR